MNLGLRNMLVRGLERVGFLNPPFPYRKYNDKKRMIFIHIPKAAGTSMLSLLGAPLRGRQHLCYSAYRNADPRRFKEYTKVAVVREPLSRLFSVYTYFLKGGNSGSDDKEFSTLVKTSCSDFDDFVELFLTPINFMRWNMLQPQSYYLFNEKGEIQVDYVLRCEFLNDDYLKLRELNSALPNEVPKINVSNQKVGVSCTSATKEKISYFYAEDYKNFYK